MASTISQAFHIMSSKHFSSTPSPLPTLSKAARARRVAELSFMTSALKGGGPQKADKVLISCTIGIVTRGEGASKNTKKNGRR